MLNLLGIIYLGIFWITTQILNLFVGLSATILTWVTSDNFVSWTFTTNPFVMQGWELTRDLTNIGFIIALVFIGLSTILRIRDYQAQKLLPILIIVALLINFTPVICGLMIDASNIIMGAFLKYLGGINIMATLFDSQTNFVISSIGTCLNSPVDCVLPAIAQGVVMTLFEIGLIFIFLVFSLLFAIRYVILWMLVILAPFAFFCYILPGTKNVWNMWWKQFIQWCIIGIFGAFFLYLGLLMMNFVRVAIGQEISIAPSASGFGVLNRSFALWFGFSLF